MKGKDINNKIKLLFLPLLALLIFALFVSCDDRGLSVDNSGSLSYVTFSEVKVRGLSIDYSSAQYDDLYWFYEAEKADTYGTYGQTKEKTRVNANATGLDLPEGTYLGPFSQGKWIFKLYAYDDEKKTTLIYKNENIGVTLLGGETKAISAGVDSVDGYGTLKINDLYFESSESISKVEMYLTSGSNKIDLSTNSSDDSNKLTLTTDSSKHSISFTSSSIGNGTYTCVVKAYKDDNTVSFKSTFYFAVYTGAATTLSGLMSEDSGEN